MAQRWTTADITRELGLTSRESARKWISRWRAKGIPAGTPVWIDPRTGERWYDAELVAAAYVASLGRGWRAGQTDTDHRGAPQ